MVLTKPKIAYPTVIPAGGQDIEIVYVGATAATETVTIPAGTYYPQNDGGAACLWKALSTALNTNAAGVTFAVAGHYRGGVYAASGTTLLTATHGTHVVLTIQFITQAHLSAKDFGFAVTAAVTTIAYDPSPNATEGDYQVPALWLPHAEDYDGRSTQMAAVVSQGVGTGEGDDDVYQGPKVWAHLLLEVAAVLVRSMFASDAVYVARVSGLVSGDTHASLEGWLARYKALLGGARPVLRWTPDVGAPGTYRSVYITTADMLTSIKGWEESEHLGPDWHDLRFTLTEKVT